jgi:rhodanese-related sulfurtransferase
MICWKRDLGRVMVILAAASAIGLATNALALRPVPILDGKGPGAWPERERRMTVQELERGWRRGRALLLLDVRAEDAFEHGHPRHALHAPATDFARHYSRLGLSSVLKAAEGVVVMCGSDACPQADRVAKELRELGHPALWVLQGGWEAYQLSGLEDVER